MLSSTPLLALLIPPLDGFALSHFHALTSHASMIFLQNKALASPHELSFACGLIKDVGRASRDASWCMHG
jgi:hypothetical protein